MFHMKIIRSSNLIIQKKKRACVTHALILGDKQLTKAYK